MVYWRVDQPPKKKVHQAKSVGKIMLIAFFDKKDMIYQHIVPTNEAKNEYNQGVLRRCHPDFEETHPTETARDCQQFHCPSR